MTWNELDQYAGSGVEIASFPGSPRAQTKNGQERGEPGKIYHVKNVIGRENVGKRTNSPKLY